MSTLKLYQSPVLELVNLLSTADVSFCHYSLICSLNQVVSQQINGNVRMSALSLEGRIKQ